jgi:tetratricopeptide (TPR) repeat protein
MTALAREAGGAVEVPPTIQAVLQARLDRLSEPERVVIERGAVEGKVFHRGSVTALAPEPQRGGVPGQLFSLVRKELVRPDRTQIPGDDAFRFRHLLIRDTAYEALPKATRAELHERFADWLTAHGELVEQDEIVGYHLEQAVRYLREFDPNDERAARIASEAAGRLGRAGRVAFQREDFYTTAALLSRAVDLLPEGAERRRLILLLSLARSETGATAMETLLDELGRGDDRDRAVLVACRMLTDVVPGPLEDDIASVQAARGTLAAAGDALGVILCDEAIGWRYWGDCRAADAHRAFLRARETALDAGSTSLQRRLINWVVITAVMSGMHLDAIVRMIDDLYAEAVEAGPLVAATLRASRARLAFVSGDGDVASLRAAAGEELAMLEQTGSFLNAGFSRNFLTVVLPRLLGDAPAVERGARERVEETEQLGASFFLANTLAMWAIALCELGDATRALEAVDRARGIAIEGDIADRIGLDCAEAYGRALHGEHEAAAALIERARSTATGIQMVTVADELDEVDAALHRLRGDAEGARALLRQLVDRCEARGARRWAEQYRVKLAELA